MNQYEGMFLFDPTFGSSYEQCETEIHRLMERASAELILCRKWDERRLAFRVKGRKRGVYVLTYFKAPADKIGGIERDVKLSETVLRVLILRADGLTAEHMEAAFVRREEEPDRGQSDGGGSYGGRDGGSYGGREGGRDGGSYGGRDGGRDRGFDRPPRSREAARPSTTEAAVAATPKPNETKADTENVDDPQDD